MKTLVIHQNLIVPKYFCEDGSQFWNIKKFKEDSKTYELEQVASSNLWSFLDVEEVK